MAVIGGIRVYELCRDFEEGIERQGGPYARKGYLVPNWADRYAVANALLGLATYDVSSAAITLNAPGAYPESADMWAQRVRVRGVGTPSQGPLQIAWTSAVIEVEYAIGQFNTSPSQDSGGLNSFDPSAPLIYASQTLDFGAQILTLPGGACTLNDGSNTVLDQPFGLPIGVVKMDLTLHRLPYLVPSTARANVFGTNSVAIFGCAVGTLRFDGVRTAREFGADGGIAQETHLSFAYRPAAPWDQILHPVVPAKGWVQVQYNGKSVLPSFDFNTLIPSAYRG